jgi:hypothetical protein
VVLDQEMPRPFDVTREILEDTYELLLDTGYYIQPWPLEKGSLDDPLSPSLPADQPRRASRGDPSRVTDDLLNRARQAAAVSTNAAILSQSQWGCGTKHFLDLCSTCSGKASVRA